MLDKWVLLNKQGKTFDPEVFPCLFNNAQLTFAERVRARLSKTATSSKFLILNFYLN